MKQLKIGKTSDTDYRHIAAKACNTLTNCIPALKKSIETVNTEILQDILTQKGETRKELENTIRAEVKKVVIPAMRSKLENELVDILGDFDKAANEICRATSEATFIPIEKYVIQNGKVYISDFENILDEVCTLYATTEEQIEAYNLAVEVSEKLNRLNEICKPFSSGVSLSFGNPSPIVQKALGTNFEVNVALIAKFEDIREMQERSRALEERVSQAQYKAVSRG